MPLVLGNDRTLAPIGSRVRYGHWSTRGLRSLLLCHEGHGRPFDYVRQRPTITPTLGDAVWAKGGHISFANVNDNVAIAEPSSDVVPTTRATVLLRRRKHDLTPRVSHCFGPTGVDTVNRCSAAVPFNDGTVYWDFGDTSGPGRLSVAGLTFTTTWERWAFVSGPRGACIYRDGVLLASSSTPVPPRSDVAGQFCVNAAHGTTGDLQDVSFFALLDAEWTAAQVSAWMANPYLMLAPTPVVTFASLLTHGPRPFLTINDIEVPNVDTSIFEILKVSGRPARCNFRIPPLGPVSRPDIAAEVICTEDFTDRLFGGLIDEVLETGVGRRTRVDDVSCGSYMDYLKWRTNVTEDFPEQSLADRIEALRVAYLDVFGVTLDPAQVTGPTLPAQAYDGWVLQDVFNHITQQSGGYAGKISDYKVLSFALPTAVPAPFDITDATGLAQRDVKVRRRGAYNRMFLKFGEAGGWVTYRFTGDGVADTFTLGTRISGPLPATDPSDICGDGVVRFPAGPTTESLGGLTAPGIWQYDPSNKTIFRTSGAVGNGVEFYVEFTTNEQPTVYAENGSAAANPKEVTIRRPKITDAAVAQALVDELFPIAEIAGLEVMYETWERGIEPDMTQTIDLSLCGISTSTFTIAQVALRFADGQSQRLKRFVIANAGEVARPELLAQADWDRWEGVGLES